MLEVYVHIRGVLDYKECSITKKCNIASLARQWILCRKVLVLLKLVRVLAFVHIYSDISYFVQSIVMMNTMSLRFRENMQMSLPKVCCMYIGPLSSMKYETFIQSLNGE